MIFLMMMITMINLMHLLQYNLPVSTSSSLPTSSSISSTSATIEMSLPHSHNQLDLQTNDGNSASTSDQANDLDTVPLIQSQEVEEGYSNDYNYEQEEDEDEEVVVAAAAATTTAAAAATTKINGTINIDKTSFIRENLKERGGDKKDNREETKFAFEELSLDIENSSVEFFQRRKTMIDRTPCMYTEGPFPESPSTKACLSLSPTDQCTVAEILIDV